MALCFTLFCITVHQSCPCSNMCVAWASSNGDLNCSLSYKFCYPPCLERSGTCIEKEIARYLKGKKAVSVSLSLFLNQRWCLCLLTLQGLCAFQASALPWRCTQSESVDLGLLISNHLAFQSPMLRSIRSEFEGCSFALLLRRGMDLTPRRLQTHRRVSEPVILNQLIGDKQSGNSQCR